LVGRGGRSIGGGNAAALRARGFGAELGLRGNENHLGTEKTER